MTAESWYRFRILRRRTVKETVRISEHIISLVVASMLINEM